MFLDRDWLVPVQLMPNHSAKICYHIAKSCYWNEPINFKRILRFLTEGDYRSLLLKQNKRGGNNNEGHFFYQNLHLMSLRYGQGKCLLED